MIGTRIKDRRTLMGLSQLEFARRAGISQQYLSRMETGQRGISLEHLGAIARVLECHPADLMDVPDHLPKSDLDLLRAIRTLPPGRRHGYETLLLGDDDISQSA